jgi:hypothetical protein
MIVTRELLNMANVGLVLAFVIQDGAEPLAMK